MSPDSTFRTRNFPSDAARPRRPANALKHCLTSLTVLILITTIAGCNSSPTNQTARSEGATTASILPNVLVDAAGAVTVRHHGGSTFIPMGFGAQLQADDLLNITGGSAAVFCGDESQWDASPKTLSSGKNRSIPCLQGRTATPAPDVARLRLRGEPAGRPADLPYALSPRTGFVLSDRPTLRWHAISGATTVTVTLESNDGLARTAKVVSGAELAYPDDWPPLQRNGADYTLSVKPTTVMSVTLSSSGSGFTALDDERAARVQALAERLKARPLSEAARALLLAELYLHHDERYPLRSEAAELLRNAPDGDKIRAIQQLLGEVYLQMGLFAEAEQPLERALSLAAAAGESEFEADALLQLGMVSCIRSNHDKAVEHWQAAQAKYAGLALAARAEQAAAKLQTAANDCSR